MTARVGARRVSAFRAFGILLLAVVTIGCGAPGPGTSGSEGPAAADDSASAADASAEALATELSFRPDQDRASRETVTFLDGGTITATSEDGTTFTLEVPPFAVAADTEITLTPLLDVQGYPADPTAVHAVQMAPEGLTFFEPSRLTITPATPIPVEEQMALESAGDGSELAPALVDPNEEDVVILVEHFSTAQLGQFSPEARQVMRSLSSSDAERRIGSAIRDAIQQERTRQLTGTSDDDFDVAELVDSYDAEYLSEVLAPLRQNAAESCFALKEYLHKVIAYERQRQLVGLPDRPESITDALAFVQSRYEACEAEAIRGCRSAKDASILVDFWMQFLASVGQGIPEPGPQMQEEARRRCEPEGFALRLDGEIPVPEWADTDGMIRINGVVRGCPSDDGSAWKFHGEFEQITDYASADYPGALNGPQEPETWYGLDMTGGQQPANVVLVYTDSSTPEEHEMWMGEFNDNVLTITDATGDPSATVRLYDGFDDLIGDLEFDVTPTDPECPIEEPGSD